MKGFAWVKDNKYIVYTVCFWAFVGPLIFYISSLGLFAAGASDAISQHYPSMVHVRRIWMDFFTALLNGETPVFPMFDFRIGMGDDTITTLHYYGLSDPFYSLTLFVTEDMLPYFYTFLFYLRIYFGGLAFIGFVSELDCAGTASAYVMGALVYCFTGFTVQGNIHVIFVHAMIYIPLMLAGAERSIHGKKRGVLCIAVFLFALSGFYFLYVGSVSLAVYVIYRFVREKKAFLMAVSGVCRLAAEYLFGLGLAAVIFVPAVVGFLSSGRAVMKTDYPLVQPWHFVRQMICNMFLPSYENIGQELAVCTIGMIVLICVFLSGKRKQEKINLVVMFLMTVIPFFSCLMSGFGECYARWELVIDLYIAFLVFSFWDELMDMTNIQKMGVAFVYVILVVFGKKNDILAQERYGKTILCYGMILFAVFILLPLLEKGFNKRTGKWALFVVAYVTVCINWRAASRDNEIADAEHRKVVAELTGEQETFYRIDNERGYMEPRLGMNVSMLQGYCGTMSYLSIINDYFINAFEDWDISAADFNVWGLDQRTILETMCAVKYFVAQSDHSSTVPYGFDFIKSTEDGEWSLYENRYCLPVAYTYDQICNIEEYQAMTGVEKQQVMLQAAALDTLGGVFDIEQMQLKKEIHKSEYSISGLQGAVLEDGTIKAEAGSTITLSAVIYPNCEYYLYYTGERLCSGEIQLEDGTTKYWQSVSPQTVNIGTAKECSKARIKMSFTRAMEIDMDELGIVYQDFSDYVGYIQKLKEDTDGKFQVQANKITGTLELDKDKILCFAVPYAPGWHASLDGEEVETYVVNDMFIGVAVPKGVHEVSLDYITPGSRAGVVISLGALLAGVLYWGSGGAFSTVFHGFCTFLSRHCRRSC